MTASRKLAFALATLVVASVVCTPAYAELDDYIDKFANNNIIFYNPEECGSVLSTGLAGNNVKEKIWNYFRDKGLSDAQAAGVLANAYQESRFVVTANSKDNPNYWGIFQFSKTHASDLFDRIKNAGLGKFLEKAYWSNDDKVEKEQAGAVDRLLQIVLDYSWNDWYKHRGNYGDWRKTIQKSESEAPKGHEPEWAAEVFVRDFEGGIEYNQTSDMFTNKYYHAGSHWQHVGIRRDMAVKFYKELGGKTRATGDKNSESGECCDPNGTKTTYMKYPGDSYSLSDGQIAAIARYYVSNSTTTNKSYAMSVVSFALNTFEKENGQGKSAAELMKYILKGSDGAKLSDAEIEKTTYTNSSLISGIKEVVSGTRIIPPQVNVSLKATDVKATNNSSDVTKKTDQYLRGITHMSSGNTKMVFWDWSSPGKKSAVIYGYSEDNTPSATVLAQSMGTTNGKTNSGATWDGGWIKSGITGYEKDAVSGVGGSFSSAAAKGSGNGPNKIMLIATESASVGKKASSLYKNSSGNNPPHFTVDMKNKKVYQHVSIDKAAAAADGNADAYAGIQVAIVGYSDSSKSGNSHYLGNKKNFTDENYKYLYTLLNAIYLETGIPISSTVNWSSSDILTGDSAKNYKGVLGLKHLSNKNTKDVPKTVWDQLFTAVTAAAKEQAQVCPSTSTGDVAALQNLIQQVAYPNYSKSIRGQGSGKQEWNDLVKKGVWYHGGCGGNDCGGFVTTMMRESGWDKGYNPGRCGTWCKGNGQLPYLRNSSKWQDVTSQIKSNKDAKPGDVLIYKSHTLLFAGSIPGFESPMVSASYSKNCAHSRPPMADAAKDIMNYIHSKNDYQVFRKVSD